MRVKDGANYILVGSVGGAPTNPVWVHKRANPAIEIRDHTAVQPMRVREVADRAERARLWELAVSAFPPYADYQTRTTRRIPIFVAERRTQSKRKRVSWTVAAAHARRTNAIPWHLRRHWPASRRENGQPSSVRVRDTLRCPRVRITIGRMDLRHRRTRGR